MAHYPPGTVAVVGLGDLGLACARRLHELALAPLGVEPDPARRGAWERESGLRAVPRVGAQDLERAFVCVRTTDQAAGVLRALRASGTRRPLTAYIITTLDPVFAGRLSECAGRGVRVVELPVSGGREAARSGTLTVLLGGDQADSEDEAFLTGTLAARCFVFPRFGDATRVKLINNVLAAYNALAYARSLELAEHAGLDPARCAEVIAVASGASWISDHFTGLVDELLAKDAGLLAAELGPLPAVDLGDPGALVATLQRVRRRLAAPA